MKLRVGDKVELLKAMLGNDSGTVGIVFYDYETGVQVIFPNGQYDGFDIEEQELYLEFLYHAKQYESYEFMNVSQVSRDFQSGFWRFDKP